MITAQSQPNYDDWGPDEYWNCGEWIEWHKALKEAYGIHKANFLFTSAYHKATLGAVSYDCRTFNSAFRQYAQENQLLDGLYEGIGAIMAPVGYVFDAGGNLIQAAGNIAEGTEDVTALLKTLIPLIVIAVVIIGLIYLSKKAKLT